MPDGRSGDDLKAIWQSQQTGTSKMTARLIQSRARALRDKTRRQLIGTVAAPLAAGFFYAFAMRLFGDLGSVLHPLFAIAMAWSLIGLYFLNRGMWPEAIPADAGFHTGLEFCREEIGRRRSLLRRLLFWSLGPILLAIATFVAALAAVANEQKGMLPNAMPFLILVVAWLVCYFVLRMREQQELKREIAELDDLGQDR